MKANEDLHGARVCPNGPKWRGCGEAGEGSGALPPPAWAAARGHSRGLRREDEGSGLGNTGGRFCHSLRLILACLV